MENCALKMLHTKLLDWKSVDFFSPHQMTPLHLGAGSGKINIVKYLVGKGADINIEDVNGVTICHINAMSD